MKPHQLEHSTQTSRRRRALFPSEDTDPDLGCITPLTDEDSEIFPLQKSLGDYDIIGLVSKGGNVHTPNVEVETKVSTPSAPVDGSPTQQLKTPHDISDNTKFPKLVRSNKNQEVTDCKNPKVRTALFPDIDLVVPSKNFYPKTNMEITSRPKVVNTMTSPKKNSKRQPLFLCNRRNKLRSGQINAGVRHKIKKRKVKKISKQAALQAAINIIESSSLNTIIGNKILDPPSPLPSPPLPRDPTPTPSPEPDPTKKFFKSSRHRGVITVNPNIKIEMNNGRLSLLPNKNPLKRSRVRTYTNPKKAKVAEFEEPLTEEVSDLAVSNIIQQLEEEENKENQSEISKDHDVLMSPTSQMCNMTSGLALNSPKKARDLSEVLEAMPGNEPKKYFPVFYPGKRSWPHRNEKNPNPSKKFKGLHKDQMLLDAGQKRWGMTQCHECKFVYQMGDPGDEMAHVTYHDGLLVLKYHGWKNERVVSNEFLDGKIIQIVPGDSKIWLKKVKEVLDLVNRELGFYELVFDITNSQVFLYIKSKTVVGVLVAEKISSGYKILTSPKDQVALCSEESYPAKCGVSRIWVAQNHRKKGIATALMDALKRNFILGYALKNEDIAFTSPTELGHLFGQKYFKTPNFLTYFV